MTDPDSTYQANKRPEVASLILTSATQSEYHQQDGQSLLDQLEDLASVNILVGANNCGKSRFMRLLATLPHYRVAMRDGGAWQQVQQTLGNVSEAIERMLSSRNLVSVGPVSAQAVRGLKAPDHLVFESDSLANVRSLLKRWSEVTLDELRRQQEMVANRTHGNPDERMAQEIRSLCKDALSHVARIPDLSDSAPTRVYIPTLRGLRPVNGSVDAYVQRTRDDYFKDGPDSDDLTIFTGLDLYGRLRAQLLGSREQRERVRKYEDFLSETIFRGEEVSIVPREGDDQVWIRIEREEERPISHLGDGVQQLIILTYQTFMLRNAFIFIEEPELFMHPGLQRQILDLFTRQDWGHTYFLTTHSNHFVDMTADFDNVAVFSFRKHSDSDGDEVKPKFIVEQVESADQRTLELLGVRSSSVFLVNATIWVEGITDRQALRHYLKLYQEQARPVDAPVFKEDLHFAFVEYGGANMPHFSFHDNAPDDDPERTDDRIDLSRICSKSLVIMDNDDNESKLERKKELEEALGDRLVILPCREIENTVPGEVLAAVVGELENPPRADISAPDYAQFQNQPLGRFVESELLGGTVTRKGGYKEGSGTWKNKGVFWRNSLRRVDRFEMLPIPVAELTRRIYEFVSSRNQ
ncbi:MAG: AAA family ATPase [Planctomycetota bacterium]